MNAEHDATPSNVTQTLPEAARARAAPHARRSNLRRARDLFEFPARARLRPRRHVECRGSTSCATQASVMEPQ